MNLEQLVIEMRRTPISLFYGAGVTTTIGGPSWDQLFAAVREHFPNGKASDFFGYMQEIIKYDNSNRAEIESFVRERLGSISPKDEHKYLFSIPWRAILTTNYDNLPEGLNSTLDGRRQIISISDPNEPVDHRREDHLYCFKLLGDCKYNFPQTGWMTLSTGDLFSVSERRTRFFEKFRNLAASGHIIYLGSSFKDELVFWLLSQMKTSLRQFPWKGFAVTPSKPDLEIAKKLELVGIEWVQGTLQELVESSKKVFGPVPQSSPVEVGYVTVHGQTLQLDRSILANIWKKFTLLSDELLSDSSESPPDFLRGASRTFHPYVFNWDYPRKTKLVWANPNEELPVPTDVSTFIKRTLIEELKNNAFFALVGIAGSGKSVASGRLAFNWHQTGNPVIFVNSQNTSIDEASLDSLMNEIRETYLEKTKNAGIQKTLPIRWLIIADDCGSILPELRTLKNHLLAAGKPADILLTARETETPIDRLKHLDVDAIYKLDDTISPTEIRAFLDFFKRFNLMDEQLVERNLRDKDVNSSFFGLIYSSISNSRKTIDKLLEDEYLKLDIEPKRIYRAVSLIQSYRVSPLRSLLLKTENVDPDWLDSQVNKGSLSGVISLSDYGKTLNVPNRFIAEAICKTAFKTAEERKLALTGLISNVTFEDLAEMEFLDNLLNGSVEEDLGPRFSVEQKIELFRKGSSVVGSRPLLIHLGRLETSAKKFISARKTFKEAYDAHVALFDERPEHVKDAEARLDLAIAEEHLATGNEASAWGYLDKAEDEFSEAKINPRITPYPYEGLGRVYLAKVSMVKEHNTQWELLLAAIQECNYVEKYRGETSEVFLLKTEIENALADIGFDESYVEKIATRIGQANGYAYLAENELSRRNFAHALELVEKGLKTNALSIWLLRLKVGLLRRLHPEKHREISNILDDYASIMTEQYDIELSFELAKETFINGKLMEAKRLFKQLSTKARDHPRRLIPRIPEDRWVEGENPKRLTGTIVRLPAEDKYGYVQTTFPPTHRGALVVRRQDVQYEGARVGDRVSYEVVFNMSEPQASRVRTI